jgi:hypothetical protein
VPAIGWSLRDLWKAPEFVNSWNLSRGLDVRFGFPTLPAGRSAPWRDDLATEHQRGGQDRGVHVGRRQVEAWFRKDGQLATDRRHLTTKWVIAS